MNAIVPSNFDYDGLPADVAADARSFVSEYRSFQRRTVLAMAEIGRQLINIRERLEHGQFLKWIEAELGSKSTAYRCMNVAEKFAPAELPTVGSLDVNTVQALAAESTPQDLRQEIIGKLASGEPVSAAQIKEQLAYARREAKHAARLRKESAHQRQLRQRREIRRQRDLERERKQRDEEEARQTDVAARAAQLVADHLGGDLPTLVSLLEGCSPWRFNSALRDLASRAGGAS
jgi:hypothetical protein